MGAQRRRRLQGHRPDHGGKVVRHHQGRWAGVLQHRAEGLIPARAGPRGKHRVSLAGRICSLLLALAMPLLPACGAQAEMIEKLPALEGATPLGVEDMAPARDALSAAFEAWLRGTYSVAGVRGFSVPGPGAEWAKWRKRMDNALGDKCR